MGFLLNPKIFLLPASSVCTRAALQIVLRKLECLACNRCEDLIYKKFFGVLKAYFWVLGEGKKIADFSLVQKNLGVATSPFLAWPPILLPPVFFLLFALLSSLHLLSLFFLGHNISLFLPEDGL